MCALHMNRWTKSSKKRKEQKTPCSCVCLRRIRQLACGSFACGIHMCASEWYPPLQASCSALVLANRSICWLFPSVWIYRSHRLVTSTLSELRSFVYSIGIRLDREIYSYLSGRETISKIIWNFNTNCGKVHQNNEIIRVVNSFVCNIFRDSEYIAFEICELHMCLQICFTFFQF